jgi:hypothetical protein
MKGRPSGYRKVAIKVGPAGQTDPRLGRATTRASAPTDQAQSSTALERLHIMKVSELRVLLSQRGLSNVGTKQDLVERLGTAVVGETEETQEERHVGAFQNSSPTRLDTVTFSMTVFEESTPVDSTMIRLPGDGNENVCLDTVTDVDTVATQNAVGEIGTLNCSERTQNSTVVSNPINLIPIGAFGGKFGGTSCSCCSRYPST